MNRQTDQQLLRNYVAARSESAFAELVRRHVDLVYSAALRMVHDAPLAEEVTQDVFVALARNAGQLTNRPVLSGWLHRTAQNLATKIVRTDVRRRAREQKAAAMNELLSAESDTVWEHIAPHLDDALVELNEGDRDALLLRYFERKSAREMADTLGTSEDAAQKRVNRAVERLRECFAKRGITVGAGGLVVVITANAVHAAPSGLTAVITTAATLAGTTIATTATATKAIAMTTLQKTLIAATILVGGVATPLLIQHQAQVKLLAENAALRQKSELVQKLQSYNQQLRAVVADPAATAALSRERATAEDERTKLMRLRNQVATARRELKERGDFLADYTLQKRLQRELFWINVPTNEIRRITVEKRIGLPAAQNVGSQTPEAALETYLWALREQDVEAYAGLMYSAEFRAAFNVKTESLLGFVGGQRKSQVEGISAIHLDSEDWWGDSQVALHYKFERDQETSGEAASDVLALKKVGAEWKIVSGYRDKSEPNP